jgi:hypothetical protein
MTDDEAEAIAIDIARVRVMLSQHRQILEVMAPDDVSALTVAEQALARLEARAYMQARGERSTPRMREFPDVRFDPEHFVPPPPNWRPKPGCECGFCRLAALPMRWTSDAMRINDHTSPSIAIECSQDLENVLEDMGIET